MDVLGERVLELGPKPEPGRPYHDFRLTRDADGVAWLLFDRADSSANTLSAEVIEGFDRVHQPEDAGRDQIIQIDSLGKPSPDPLAVIPHQRQVFLDQPVSQLHSGRICPIGAPNFLNIQLLSSDGRGHAILRD